MTKNHTAMLKSSGTDRLTLDSAVVWLAEGHRRRYAWQIEQLVTVAESLPWLDEACAVVGEHGQYVPIQRWDRKRAVRFAGDCLRHARPRGKAGEMAYWHFDSSMPSGPAWCVAWAADTEREREWQARRLLAYLNGEE